MTRNLKVLGLSLVAAFAMSAVAASSAWATFPFTSPEGAVDLTGSQTTQNIFKTAAGEVKCSIANFSGTNTLTSSSEQTITPSYEGCEAFGEEADVKLNGCDYLFTTPTSKVGDVYSGPPPHVICPGAAQIEITVTALGSSICTVTVEPQTPTSGSVDYTNEGTGTTRDIKVTSTVEGIHYTVDYPGIEGALCGTSKNLKGEKITHTDGKYTGAVTLKGYIHNQAHTEVNRRGILVD